VVILKNKSKNEICHQEQCQHNHNMNHKATYILQCDDVQQSARDGFVAGRVRETHRVGVDGVAHLQWGEVDVGVCR